MSSRLFFSLLVLLVILIASLGFYGAQFYQDNLPSKSCTSVIENGRFIGDDLKSYTLNGNVVFRLPERKISVFGVLTTEDGQKIMRRELYFNKVHQGFSGNVSGAICKRYISPTDNAGVNRVLFSSQGENIDLSFSRIRKGLYLVLINDNWVMMCREKNF